MLKEEIQPVNPPSFALSMVPILFPIVLILLNTVTSSIMGEAQPEIFQFLGDKTTALLAGAIIAYLIGVKCMGQRMRKKQPQILYLLPESYF